MSIRDVMDTSWEDLMGVLGETESAKTEEVMDLADFLEKIKRELTPSSYPAETILSCPLNFLSFSSSLPMYLM